MYTNEDFRKDCMMLFEQTEGNTVDIPGIGETVLYDEPSTEWLYARIEGQDFIGKYMAAIKKMLEEKGITACVPSSDERFGVKIEITIEGLKPAFHADSKWSECPANSARR